MCLRNTWMTPMLGFDIVELELGDAMLKLREINRCKISIFKFQKDLWKESNFFFWFLFQFRRSFFFYLWFFSKNLGRSREKSRNI